jgi:hypothetical protein
VRAVVSATDGGGTVQVASPPSAEIPIAEPAPARLTAWFERAGRRLRRATVTWPARVRIRGRLTDRRGRPLTGAPVRVLERVPGGRWRTAAGLSTLRDGRLSTFTHVGPSRQVRLSAAHATATLGLRVRAAVTLRVRRHAAGGGLTLVSGRVLGGRVPRAGLRLRLQSRGAGGWRTRALLRSDGLGRFSATGRAPSGARFRVVVPAQRGYPFLRGVSPSR